MFGIKRSFVCVFCDSRKTDGIRFRHGGGICCECDRILPRTSRNGSFDGGFCVPYVLAPTFYTEPMRSAIMRYKFEDWSCCEDVFVHLMLEYIKNYPHLKDFDAVVPVPISRQRLRERGFNQSVPLSKAIAKYFDILHSENMLVKIRHTQRQSRLAAQQRAENVKDAYAARPDLVKNKRIILVDDIYTTGITMNECAKTLKNAGAAEVIGISLSIVYKKEKDLMYRYKEAVLGKN